MHGKWFSEHDCLYCCLCYRDLTPEECNVLPDDALRDTQRGREREDVCIPCARREAEVMAAIRLRDIVP